MSTPILPFEVWESGTNQNSIPANDNALRSEILNGLVISASTTAQPASPANGDIYIIPASATGAQWATFTALDLAIYRSGTWYAYAPVTGIVVNLAGTPNAFNGTAYVAVGGGGGSGDVVGPAGATADRIAVFDGTTGKLIKDGGKTIASLRAPAIQSVTSAATVTPTFLNDLVKITAQAVPLTLANPTGTAIDALGMVIRIKDDGTARAITYGSQYRAIGVVLPTTTVATKTTYLAMIYNAQDTTWDVVAVGTQA
ncbi:DUF2793 domain-containing protein [Xanthomonas sp. NCPPB 3005]|uniref:DUF2793 domain-containing protein n=1 Tax=Xanthomonas sp. NCPPB 3005 TaxID=3240913 RepID=UPI003512875B